MGTNKLLLVGGIAVCVTGIGALLAPFIHARNLERIRETCYQTQATKVALAKENLGHETVVYKGLSVDDLFQDCQKQAGLTDTEVESESHFLLQFEVKSGHK